MAVEREAVGRMSRMARENTCARQQTGQWETSRHSSSTGSQSESCTTGHSPPICRRRHISCYSHRGETPLSSFLPHAHSKAPHTATTITTTGLSTHSHTILYLQHSHTYLHGHTHDSTGHTNAFPTPSYPTRYPLHAAHHAPPATAHGNMHLEAPSSHQDSAKLSAFAFT